jgi:DNA-binding response OmpR family regulator
MKTFVIIDDSMVMRTVLRYMLERCGHKVLAEGKDHDEEAALVARLNPDAVVVGAALRGETGYSELPGLRDSGWTGKVFAAVTGGQETELHAARGAGVDGILTKPFVLDQVEGEVKRVLGQE